MRSFYLYKVTNLINNKVYIGITSNPKSRKYQHLNAGRSSLLSKAVKKYGKDSFEFKILCEGEKSYILNLEAEAIKVFQTISPRGYNIRPGGENYSSGYSIEYRSDDSHCYVCGFWFPNRRTALRSLRLNDKTFHKWKSEGTLGSEVHLSKDSIWYSPTYVSGFWWPTLQIASEVLNISKEALMKRVRVNNLEAESKRSASRLKENNPMFGRTGKNHPNSRAIKIFGILYDSISDAVRQTNLTKSVIEKSLKKNKEGFEYVDPS